jgi:hypothetical protein
MTPAISNPAVALITPILVAMVIATNGLKPADPKGSDIKAANVLGGTDIQAMGSRR